MSKRGGIASKHTHAHYMNIFRAAARGELDEVKRLIRNNEALINMRGRYGKLFVCFWWWSDSPLDLRTPAAELVLVCRDDSFDVCCGI